MYKIPTKFVVHHLAKFLTVRILEIAMIDESSWWGNYAVFDSGWVFLIKKITLGLLKLHYLFVER